MFKKHLYTFQQPHKLLNVIYRQVIIATVGTVSTFHYDHYGMVHRQNTSSVFILDLHIIRFTYQKCITVDL